MSPEICFRLELWLLKNILESIEIESMGGQLFYPFITMLNSKARGQNRYFIRASVNNLSKPK